MPRRPRVVTVAAVLVALGLVIGGAPGAPAARKKAHWKGAETFEQTSVAPNPGRCGAFPPNVEATFAGSGVDTVGGAFDVRVSACLDTGALHIFDLEATDIYVQSGDSIEIAPDDFTLVLDPATCTATNSRPVRFRVAGGTGAYEGARGGGTSDFALNWGPCNGLVTPTYLWFRGHIKTVRPL